MLGIEISFSPEGERERGQSASPPREPTQERQRLRTDLIHADPVGLGIRRRMAERDKCGERLGSSAIHRRPFCQ